MSVTQGAMRGPTLANPSEGGWGHGARTGGASERPDRLSIPHARESGPASLARFESSILKSESEKNVSRRGVTSLFARYALLARAIYSVYNRKIFISPLYKRDYAVICFRLSQRSALTYFLLSLLQVSNARCPCIGVSSAARFLMRA